MSTRTEHLCNGSAQAILGPNPFVGFKLRDIAREVVRVSKFAVRQPQASARAVKHFSREISEIMRGQSALTPKPRDKRFSDPAWKTDLRYRRWLQSYLALEHTIGLWLEEQRLPAHSRARLEFVIALITDAFAPSNFPFQPEAVRRFKQTQGRSAVDGLRNLVHDLRDNGGLPSQVDKSKFKVGGNIANTPGHVVLRTEVAELIQYSPSTAQVRQAPLLFIPPQINKYYIFDLSPEKSVVKAAVEQGFQVFMISWRNPTAEHSDWGLGEYAAAIDVIISAICNLTGSSSVNVAGACAGGLTVAAYVAARAAAGDRRVGSLTLVVNVLDTKAVSSTPFGMFATPRAIEHAKRQSAADGVLDGKSMSSVFAWLRPNDLIWNYWVNNVLLGNSPPAFDLLYWNNDSTRLPARLHAEFIDIFQSNAMTISGKLRVQAMPVDLRRITCDSYILGGTTDHITPWKACYRNTQLFGGRCTFVLSNAGHMQSILNPPGNKRSEFWTGGELGADPEEWRKSAAHHPGSWWPHWHQWLHERSGELVDAPRHPGNADYVPLEAAPGLYVHA